MQPTFRVADAPQLYRWTRDEFYRLGEMGVFDGRRVQLIEGDVIEMPPIGPDHATGTTVAMETLRLAFASGYIFRVQQPLDFGPASQPDPDLAIVSGAVRDFASHHPVTAVLVVEIASASLAYERREKASLYAKAGILDYWIVNLVDRQLEVYRDPGPDPSQPSGHGYATAIRLQPSETSAPLANPDVAIQVASLLP